MKVAGAYAVLERPAPRLRVLFFHHGGGSAMSFLSTARQLPEGCEPYLFELRGRGMRPDVPPAPDFAAALTDFADLAPEVSGVPLLLVGQSLGGLLAHSLAIEWSRTRLADVRAVVLSSCVAPAVAAARATRAAAPFQVRTRQQVERQLRVGGGCDPSLFDEPDFLEEAVDMLGRDLHLADTYTDPGPLTQPVEHHIWYGSLDPFLTREDLDPWRAATSQPPVFREFPGSHFLLGGDPTTLALNELVGHHLARQELPR